MVQIPNFNISTSIPIQACNKTQAKIVFKPTKTSFASSNPFATDILDISSAKKAEEKSLQKVSVNNFISFLGDKVKTETIKAQIKACCGVSKEHYDAEKILSVVNKENIDCVIPLIKAEGLNGSSRFYEFDVIKLLETVNSENKDVLMLLANAQFSGENKQLNANTIRSILNAVNKDSIDVLKVIIEPQTNKIDNRIVMGLDIPSVLSDVTPKNKDNMIALWQATNCDGSPKLNKHHVVQFAKSTRPQDIPLLFDLLQFQNKSGGQLFCQNDIDEIFSSKKTDKKQLIDELKDLPNLNGARIAKVVSKFDDFCLEYLKQNINDPYRVDLLFALQPYSDLVSIQKIIESPNIDSLNNSDREHLAELIARKEYKDVVRQLHQYNIPLLPKMEHRDDFMNYLLSNLKQNVKLERLPWDRVNHFRYHLNQLQEHLKVIDPAKDINFNNIYDHQNILINLPEHLTDLKNDLNTLIYVLPETRRIFENSETAKAMLTTLSALCNDETYASLSEKDREFAKIATILSFLPVDGTSTKDVALEARISISRLDYSQREQGRIFDLVNNQNWLERFVLENLSAKGVVSDCFVRPGDYEILTALTKAKIRTANSEMTRSQYKKAINDIKPLLDEVIKTSINLPQTYIPKASELHLPYEEIGENGRTHNKVVRMSQTDNFEALGFPQGTNRDNIYLVTHVINENIDKMMAEEMMAPVSAFDCRDTVNYINYADSVGGGNFSASLISMDNNNVFINQRFGFIFDVDPANIAIASQDDVWSGFDKNESVFTNNLFSPRRDGYSNSIKETLSQHVESDAVESVYASLHDKQSLTDVDYQIAPHFKTAIDNGLMNSKEHNELLLRSPKVKALFCKDDDPNKMPYTMRHYAETHDLPILVFEKLRKY